MVDWDQLVRVSTGSQASTDMAELLLAWWPYIRIGVFNCSRTIQTETENDAHENVPAGLFAHHRRC